MSDFETSLGDDPLELLKRINQLMHTPQKTKYPSLTVVKIITNFLRCKQGEKESLVDYLSHFESERDVLFHLRGKDFLDGFSEKCPGYAALSTSDEEKAFKKKELDKFLAVLFLHNVEQNRYADLLLEFRKAFEDERDIYKKRLRSS